MSEITPSPAADALKSSGFVVVRAANVTVFETLAEALAREGHRSAWLDPNSLVRVPTASALVWDAPQLDRPEWNLLDRCRERLPKLPLVMLAGFPRGDDFEQANQREVAALLGKPYRIADLHAALSAAMARREQATASERLRVG